MAKREIKFRVWITDINEMFTVVGLDIQQNFIRTTENKLFGTEQYAEIMQFTGLIDRNGKEIYEGDIVNNSVASWVVKFNRGCFCGDMIKPKPLTAETLIALRAIKDIYVIGNIYKNKTLLSDGEV